MQRLFVAIDFPEEVNKTLIGMCNGIERAKWIKPGQIHLTLRFIGDSHDEQTELLKLALAEIDAPQFSLELKGAGTFPPDKRKRPKVLWVGVGESKPLLELQADIEQAARSAGFKPEPRHFHPHVTLAHFPTPPGQNLDDWLVKHKQFKTEPITINEFHLVQSKLTPDGAIHSAMEAFELS